MATPHAFKSPLTYLQDLVASQAFVWGLQVTTYMRDIDMSLTFVFTKERFQYSHTVSYFDVHYGTLGIPYVAGTIVKTALHELREFELSNTYSKTIHTIH